MFKNFTKFCKNDDDLISDFRKIQHFFFGKNPEISQNLANFVPCKILQNFANFPKILQLFQKSS